MGGVASDQLWHAVCIWTNADMLTRRVPNSRARQSAHDCPLSAGERDAEEDLFLFLIPVLLVRCPDAHVMCAHDGRCVFDEGPVLCAMWTQMNHTVYVFVLA